MWLFGFAAAVVVLAVHAVEAAGAAVRPVEFAPWMTEMISAQRSYQMASQAIQYQDQMLQIANQIKR